MIWGCACGMHIIVASIFVSFHPLYIDSVSTSHTILYQYFAHCWSWCAFNEIPTFISSTWNNHYLFVGMGVEWGAGATPLSAEFWFKTLGTLSPVMKFLGKTLTIDIAFWPFRSICIKLGSCFSWMIKARASGSKVYLYRHLLWIPRTILDQNFDLKSQCAYYMRTKYPGFFSPTQPTFWSPVTTINIPGI